MMRWLHQRFARIRGDEAGLSMTELLVAAMLTSVMLVMVGTMFIQTLRLTTAATQTRNSNGVASSMSNGITSVLRTATTRAVSGTEIPEPAIVSGTRNSLTIYAYSDTIAATPAPVKVTYWIDSAGVLWEKRCAGTASGGFWTYGGCGTGVDRRLGDGLQNSASDTLFGYRSGDGNIIVIGNNPLSDAQRATVGSITVTVKVKAPGSTNDAVVIASTVVLRNLGLDTGAEE